MHNPSWFGWNFLHILATFCFSPFLNDILCTLPNLKEFSDDNFKFDENGGEFSKRVENTVMSNFSLSHSVCKRPVLQTRKNKGLFGKGLILYGRKKSWTCPNLTNSLPNK